MKIEAYQFGSMTIDGKTFQADLILFPDRIKPNWWRKEGHSLAVEDLEEILKEKPEVLVVGQGYSGCMKIPPETKRVLQHEKILLISKETGEAYKIFNEEASQGKKVIGAFHLTC